MNIQYKKVGLSNEEERITPGRAFQRKKSPVVIFLLLIMAIITNFLPFQSLGLQTRLTGYNGILQAINAGSKSKRDIILRPGLYRTLGEIAPGVKFLLPEGTHLDIAQLYGLGRVKNVIHEKYDPEIAFANVDLSNHIVADFNADERLCSSPYRIALAKEDPHTIVLLRRNNIWYLVDASLLPLE